MLRSMYSGVTGMKSQQTKMDVIANNIANSSTTGFKSGRVRFGDMISQTVANAQGATPNRGGVNAQQVGLGVQVSGIDTIMTGGSLQATGRGLDFGIQNGDNSFFIVSPSGETGDNEQFTRDGGFYTDASGALVTSSGMHVLGKTASPAINMSDKKPAVIEITNNDDLKKIVISKTHPTAGNNAELQSFNIDQAGNVIATYGNGDTFKLGRVALATFDNPDGLEKAGGNLYNASASSGTPQQGGPENDGFGEIRSGFLEMSNVDLANEFTEMIVTSRAYQANSRSITTSDEMLQELLSLKR